MIKPHIPQRTVQSNPFNKDRFKGNNEKLNDWDLETTLYVYEPQTFADLRAENIRAGGRASENDIEQSYKKYDDGGYYFINLVPFKEQPEIKVTITSRGGSTEMLTARDVLAGYTNVVLPEVTTKRIYSLVKLDNGVPAEVLETLWEENNDSFVINNDDSVKQVSFTLNKILSFQREANAMFFSRRFFVNTPIPKDINAINIKWKGGKPVVGETTIKNTKGSSLTKNLLFKDKKQTVIDVDKWRDYNNPWHPQYLEPIVTDNGIRWQPLWVWEWQYARAQWDGKYPFKFIKGGSNTSEKPSNKSGIDLTHDYLYNKTSPIGYRTLKSSGSLGGVNAGKVLNFVLPYGVLYALKSELSCHRMLYLEQEESGAGKGVFGLKYQDSSANGARSYTTTGKWGSKDTMMVMDYAYDPNVFFALDNMRVYITEIKPGVFRHSENWKSLCDQIIEGNVAYGGTSWTSSLGMLREIRDTNLGGDLSRIAPNGSNKMLLFPASIEEIGGNDKWQTENMLNTAPIQGVEEPKIRTGILDIKPEQIQTNAIQGFYGSYIREEENIAKPRENYQLTFALNDKDVIGQLLLNYHGAQEIEINFCSEDEEIIGNNYVNIIKTIKIPTEYASNRQTSGGVSISFF